MPGILWAVLQKPITVLPLFSDGKPHHVTLQYGVERDEWEAFIGKPINVLVVEHCWNDRIQAVRVVLPEWVQCQNAHPHITVSWVSGSAPVEANAMLSGEHHREPYALQIPAIIEWLEWKKNR